MKAIRKFLIVIFALSFFSCQQEKPTKNLSYTKRKKIDSLLKANTPFLDSTIEMECLQLEANMLPYWVDSLYGKRMEEIDKLRGQ